MYITNYHIRSIHILKMSHRFMFGDGSLFMGWDEI